MGIHHSVLEKDIKENCAYCGASLKGVDPHLEFEGLRHYETRVCENGHMNAILQSVFSSGHDEGLVQRVKDVDRRHSRRI